MTGPVPIPFDQGVTALPKLWPWVKVGTTPDGLDIIDVPDVGRYVFGKGGLREFDAWVQYGTNPMPQDVRKYGSRYLTNAEYVQHVYEIYNELVPGGGAQLLTAEDGAPYLTPPHNSDAYRAAGWIFVDNVGWERDGVPWNEAFERAMQESAPPPNPLPPDPMVELANRVARLEALLLPDPATSPAKTPQDSPAPLGVPATRGPGDPHRMERVVGKITGFQTGFRNGEQVAEFIDQDGNYLTYVPRSELGQYMTLDGTSRFFVAAINGVPVWEQLMYVDAAPNTPQLDAAPEPLPTFPKSR